ncbi:S-layer homology domain-containing protein [Bacillus sp. PS06]|uniref:S-layer homology domain-containing protein n=1 Tax=Bacillus sp. PS06 TaxID=2764176 RepID=UPI00178590D0|nr:S-layer homology domain-containing protein [Bacillus sp. PS06]MBD8067463.1 S-layer homology domain-containing protein [Bacillus sp. PS06]
MKRMKRKTTLVALLCTVVLTVAFHATAQTNRFNMSYLYFGSPTTFINQVNATKGSLNVVSPNYFDISPEGDLKITWLLQSSFINEMHKRGIKVVPFLSNHWDLVAGRNALLKRDQLAKDIAAAVEKYNLDGVNVDIEGVGRSGEHSGYFRSYRDEHTDFIRLLRQYIPKDKEISVSVAGNPNGWTTGWHGFYDYKGISDYANYLMIMAYDESWQAPDSPIGPVASLSFWERCILFALGQNVPKEKIVNGLPFYGRMWKLDGPNTDGVSITGNGLSSTRIAPLINQFNGKYLYDETKQSAYATFTVPKGAEAFVGTLKISEGNYVIWYENERSIKAKLRLVSKYDIKGTGSWALFHEVPETWDYYSLWLNGKFFTDVPTNHWSEASILSVSGRGWMAGTSSTQFSPNSELTRAQGAVILVRALGLADITPKQYVFTDTSRHWARKEIEIAREYGMINGLGNNRFGPNDPLTREQLAAILQNIFNFSYETANNTPFPDINPNNWSYDSILAIHQNGYLSGFGDGTFRPKDKSTRAQMAALMDRMASEFDTLPRR